LVQHLFRLKKPAHEPSFHESTYEVAGELEETQVVAAHLLTDTRPKIEPRYIVRIRQPDLVATGVQAADSVLGTTGLVWVDFRHRDLVGGRDQLQALVGTILQRLEEGEDRVRRFGGPQLRWALSQFQALPTEERPTHTAAILARVLAGQSLEGLPRDTSQAHRELPCLRLPEEAVRLHAFCRHEQGHGTGSPDGDWLRATERLRRVSAQHYLDVFGM
jgi:hypothetical protein